MAGSGAGVVGSIEPARAQARARRIEAETHGGATRFVKRRLGSGDAQQALYRLVLRIESGAGVAGRSRLQQPVARLSGPQPAVTTPGARLQCWSAGEDVCAA